MGPAFGQGDGSEFEKIPPWATLLQDRGRLIRGVGMPGSRKYRPVFVGASIVTLGLLLAILFYRPVPEPSWKGRPVSAWVRELRVFGSDSEIVAEEAILHLGPQAAPCLIANLRKSDTLFSDFWFSNYPRLPAWVRKKVAAPRARWEARADAAHGLE